jgi:Flp pilus assembly protein TadG
MAFRAIHRFFNDRRGGITSMFALGVPVVAFAIGAAVDYGRAAQVRTKLNAAADAAALAALTPAMLQQGASAGQTAAVNMFNGQISGVTGLAPNLTSVTVTITNPNGNMLIETVTVCYNAATQTMFAGILGVPTLGIGNCATASAQLPPNIDFYLLLDNSPSMSLPATQAGITQMESLTTKQATGGCAFACHQASTNNGDTAGNPCADGTAPTQSSGAYCAASQGAQIDDFQLAKNHGITLRLDELNSAVSTLMQTAYSTANSAQFSTPPTYRFSTYSMDTLWSIGLNQLMPLTTNYVANWTTASANFGVMEMFSNNNDCANSACSSGTTTPGGDVGTNYDDSLGKLSQASYIPNPGNGTNQSGDTPQEVLFIVTDGVEDEQNGGRLQQAINDLGNAPGGNSSGTNWCTTIKSRSIKIAILYTDYLPVTANSWYNSYVAPIQSDIGPALQACASPGLFYDAAIGADLGQALSSLFQAVVQNGHLTN